MHYFIILMDLGWEDYVKTSIIILSGREAVCFMIYETYYIKYIVQIFVVMFPVLISNGNRLLIAF